VLKPPKMFLGIVLLLLCVGLASVMLSPAEAFAQSVDTAWVRRYNGSGNGLDDARALALDDSGNVYVTGMSLGDGTSADIVTIKYLPDGDTAWLRRYDGPLGSRGDEARGIATDVSGNVYVTGSSSGDPPDYLLDYTTIKYLPNGDTAWVRRYDIPGGGADRAYAVTVDSSGNVYVTGSSDGCWGNSNIVTIKYYPDGVTAWEAIYSGLGNGDDGSWAIVVDGSGEVYVTGWAFSSQTDQDLVTLRYSSDGGAWRTYNGPADSSDGGWAIAIDGSGNVYVAGYSLGSGTSVDYVTIKYLADGDTAWVRRYNGPGNGYDVAYDIAVDGSGNVYVTGRSEGIGTGLDYATIKYLPSGHTAWVRRYNGPGNDRDDASTVAVDNSGNVYVTGGSKGIGTYFDNATIKYLPDGDSGWVMRYNGPGDSLDSGVSMAVDDSGNVYVTGPSYDSETHFDYCTIKYVQGVTGVQEETESEEKPSQIGLSENYPNPFNPATVIDYSVDRKGLVLLVIYDVLGRQVRTLVNERKERGGYSVRWDGKDDEGRQSASGVYFYQLKVGDYTSSKKMVLLK
jgi:uncharacterized delta-60 repeat protein